MIEDFPIDALWFRILIGLILGLTLGSFTTMLSYRVPRRLSIVVPPSHCPNCKTPLKPRDLVPVMSWVAEKGKCRHCKGRISARYLFIELVTTAAVCAATIMLGINVQLIPAIIGSVSLITLVTINIERHRDF